MADEVTLLPEERLEQLSDSLITSIGCLGNITSPRNMV